MTLPLPATIIGGYLGAGKTTLVNHLLRNANGRRLAILVNEFGALPIDEDLIEAQSDDLISIAGGCICCSFGSDLIAAMQQMRIRGPQPDHVVIESSGVAMPGAIAATIGLLEGFKVAAIVVLADCETVRTQAADEYLGDTTLRQLHEADLIVQTKIDLVGKQQRDDVTHWLKQINPRAVVLSSAYSALPNELILGVAASGASTMPGSNVISADSAFESKVFIVESAADPRALAEGLTTTETGVIRAKGFVRNKDGQLWLIQTVGNRFSAEPTEGSYLPQMVIIGLKDKPNWPLIESLF